jgi:hypothetical protein
MWFVVTSFHPSITNLSLYDDNCVHSRPIWHPQQIQARDEDPAWVTICSLSEMQGHPAEHQK